MTSSNWSLVSNPAWADELPQGLEHSDCHDGSHFVTIECDGCGEQLHLHESQTKAVPRGQGIATGCPGCGSLLAFAPGILLDVFAQMRRSGWIR